VFSTGEAERIARELYGLSLVLEALPGERDANFVSAGLEVAPHHRYVLKVLGSQSDATDCQVRVLRHLAEQDPTLPVPRIQATLQGGDLGRVYQNDASYSTCLMGYVEGRPLDNPNSPLLHSVGSTLARLDRALRGFFHPALAQRIAWDVRRLPELVQFAPLIDSPDLRRCVEYVAGKVREGLCGWKGLRSQAIHGDCHGANIVVAPEGTHVCGIVDFGDMMHAPLIVELAVAMAELVDPRSDLEPPSALLGGYAAAHALESADIAALYDLICARYAVTLVVHAWRRRHDVQGARVLDGAAALAGPALDWLLTRGRNELTSGWHRIAGTADAVHATTIDLARRHRLLGAGAELFYEEPLHLVRGEGVWLYDAGGRAYLDVYNNVPHVGHCHPTVVNAIQRQTAALSTHTRYLHDGILRLAEGLTARCPAHLDACIFVNSGSEANDVAWRLAQFASGQRGALVLEHAYHGITDAVAALTPGGGASGDPRVVTLGLPDARLTLGTAMNSDALAAARSDMERAIRGLESRGFGPAALFLDTALTSSGILDPPLEWMAALAERVRAAGGLVVADEVQYGFGRSGSHFWGFERRGLSPDLVTLGKPMGNGYPLGAVIANRGLVEAFQARHGFFSTFGGNPVGAAAGLAVLDVLDHEHLMANAFCWGSK
jgi:4-aminobutyrate aminotransferase-like enzyme/Ser/Thr protein kinase RdoA (MazF antagonist)